MKNYHKVENRMNSQYHNTHSKKSHFNKKPHRVTSNQKRNSDAFRFLMSTVIIVSMYSNQTIENEKQIQKLKNAI
jgi:hypothetical protein